ncbi:collagen-like triple helix repeat-containing protein [Tepidicaulis marinus]|nr:collagen-like triple helix repeat-containing protein [Tepidicaulis marinus]
MRTTFTPLGHPFWRAAPLAFAISFTLAACGSSSDGPGAGLGDGGGGGGGSAEPASETQATENIVQDAATITQGVGQTLFLAGIAVSQEDLPLDQELQDHTIHMLGSTGSGVYQVSKGLDDGLGSLGTNDNAVGTTAAGTSKAVSSTGDAVSASGRAVAALDSLPVFLQVEENSGALTMVGENIGKLGLQISEGAEGVALQFEDPDSPLGSASRQLTLAIRPIVANVEGTTRKVGDAIVIGPMGSELLSEAGSAITMAGDELADQNAAFTGVARSVGGAGALVRDTGGLISSGEGSGGGLTGGGLPTDTLLAALSGGEGAGLPTDAVLGQLTDSGLPTDDLLGSLTEGGLPTDQLTGLVGGEGADPVTGLVGGLTGGLSGGSEDGEEANPVTRLIGGLTGGLSGSDQ